MFIPTDINSKVVGKFNVMCTNKSNMTISTHAEKPFHSIKYPLLILKFKNGKARINSWHNEV